MTLFAESLLAVLPSRKKGCYFNIDGMRVILYSRIEIRDIFPMELCNEEGVQGFWDFCQALSEKEDLTINAEKKRTSMLRLNEK